ncbi:MAG TPA: hypothetical protein VNS57_08995 [Steroidobacteraceae bacterium]|nr:hypothetical protein [Steroidobacteraceae bacterium]
MSMTGRSHASHDVVVTMLLVATLLGASPQTTASPTTPNATPVSSGVPDAPAAIDAHLEREAAALGRQLDPRVAATLDRIDGLGPRLLALRAYLRAGASLQQRWSWTDRQIANHETSPLRHALEVEIDRVRIAFETANPGYTLWVNPRVRSLEVQLEGWNTNASVATAGATLLADVRRAMAAPIAEARGPATAGARLATFLDAYAPPTPAALAAPGLSPHGRMGAVDFHVRQGEQTVATPDTRQVASVWDAQGWRERLRDAVRTASPRFHGPLPVPDEPWHYDYRPEAGVLAEQ